MEKLISEKKKCLGVFNLVSISDNVEEYVFFLLNELKTYMDDLIILCSKSVNDSAYLKLQNYTHSIFKSKNGVISSTEIREHCELELLRKYDQILFFDDTFYGPIYPMEDVFNKMNNYDVDFWGITYNGEMIDQERGSVPASLDCYFVALNNKVVSTKEFERIYNSSEENFASNLIFALTTSGFSWKAYVDSDDYISPDFSKNIDRSTLISYELVKKYCCPFIRKESFNCSKLVDNSGENARNLLEFIEKNTDYDTKMIWDDLLKRYNVLDIKNMLNLDYVLPYNAFYGDQSIIKEKKIAVIIHLHYLDLVDECFEYIKKIPSVIDVYITTSTNETREKIEKNILSLNLPNCNIVKKNNRGRDVSALLVACRDLLMKYEYLCFIHDKKSSAYLKTVTEGKSFMHNMWENMLKNNEYICNVIQCFENKKRLGLLVPPEPFHGTYVGILGNEWTNNYENVISLAKKLDINCKFDENKPPFTLGTTFWCRTAALKPLFSYKFEYTDFPDEPMGTDGTFSHAIERIFSYVAQSEMYYSASVMHTDYAAIRMNGLQSILLRAVNILKNETLLSNFFDISKVYEETPKLYEFCKKYNHIYIYGAGIYGNACYNTMMKNNLSFDGYVVSDGQDHMEYLNNHKVYEVSEIKNQKSDCGIILALNSKHQKEVYPHLGENGYSNLYYFV